MSFDPASAKYVNLVTYRKSGTEVRTPVWIAPHDDRHYVFSEATAGKMKRLRNNSAVKFALCDMRGKILNENWLNGDACVVDDSILLKQVYASFIAKYGWVMRMTDFFSKLSGKYSQRAMIEITISTSS